MRLAESMPEAEGGTPEVSVGGTPVGSAAAVRV